LKVWYSGKVLMKMNIWFIIGVGSAGVMLGYLTGASSSPIASVVVSSVFGAALGLVAGRLAPSGKEKQGKEADGKEEGVDDAPVLLLRAQEWQRIAPLIGIGLTVFSAFFVGGTVAGGWLRHAWPHLLHQDGLTVPWKRSTDGLPTTPQDAWKWITFAHDAKGLGLDSEEIFKLFERNRLGKVPLEEATPTWPSYRRGDTSAPGQAGPIRGDAASP
jgi:hypothetical protein